MKKILKCWCIVVISLFCLCSRGNAKTEQEMIQEYNKWMEILGPELGGIERKPVKIFKYQESWSKRRIIDICGTVELIFDSATGELMKIINTSLGNMRAAESSQGKTVPFTLTREDCQAIAAKYFKLITGEQLPDVGGLLENTWPRSKSGFVRPSHYILFEYPRFYKGYKFRDETISLGLFAMDGKFETYNKFYRSNSPSTVEVKITVEQAKQKAIEITGKEIKNWVSFLDSFNKKKELQQLSDRELKRKYGYSRETLKELKEKTASLIGLTSKEEKPPYLEIVNLQRDAFHQHYFDMDWYKKSQEFNPDTRLCWIVRLLYLNKKTKASAAFEVWIDAYDGSFVGGYRPWD